MKQIFSTVLHISVWALTSVTFNVYISTDNSSRQSRLFLSCVSKFFQSLFSIHIFRCLLRENPISQCQILYWFSGAVIINYHKHDGKKKKKSINFFFYSSRGQQSGIKALARLCSIHELWKRNIYLVFLASGGCPAFLGILWLVAIFLQFLTQYSHLTPKDIWKEVESELL